MARSTQNTAAYRFGVFELDLRAAELRKNGVKLRLQDQPYQVLIKLLERPGETVRLSDEPFEKILDFRLSRKCRNPPRARDG